jgi:hypothetical protein
MQRRKLHITLISPKGPLYRYRGGIFKQSLRYMPLTLPTLAALIPNELDAQVTCIDEGIADIDLNLDSDLVGMTVITGTAPRAYELAAHFRRRNIPVVLGVLTSRWFPTTRSLTLTASLSVMRKMNGRACCATSLAAVCSRATSSPMTFA